MKETVLFLSEFHGSYPGSFMTSLWALEDYLSTLPEPDRIGVVYAFPDECRQFQWCKTMEKEGKRVYYYHRTDVKNDYRYLCSVVKKEKITIIHTHFEAMGRAVYLFSFLHPHVLVVWHRRNDFSLGAKQAKTFFLMIKRYVTDRLVTTIALSPHMNTKRGYVLENHLDVDRIPGDWKNPSRNVIRERFGFTNRDIIVLMFGWNKEVKGVDIGCRMLQYLPDDTREKIRLCIVMPDNEENRDYIRNHSKFPEQVYLLEKTDDVFQYHCSADIMLSASRSEAFANTILEALSVATTVVSSDIPGTQWSKQYASVFFFESNNPSDAARALCASIQSADDRNEKNQQAEEIQSKYAIHHWCEAIYQIYCAEKGKKSAV